MTRNRNRTFTVTSIAIVIVVVLIVILLVTGEGFKRNLKSLKSNYTGGLDRTVTVYDYNGNPIKSWTGKFDLSEDDNEIFFDDDDGKRVIIHGGLVICEEN